VQRLGDDACASNGKPRNDSARRDQRRVGKRTYRYSISPGLIDRFQYLFRAQAAYPARRWRYRAGVSPIAVRKTRVRYCTLAKPLALATCLIVASELISSSWARDTLTR